MANPIYDEIKSYFVNISEVEVNQGKGAQGIKFKGKMFAMFSGGNLMLQFPIDRIKELIKEGIGEEVSYAKDRVIIPDDYKNNWIELTEEALSHRKNQ